MGNNVGMMQRKAWSLFVIGLTGTLITAPAYGSGWVAGEQTQLELTARLSERLDIRFGVSTTDAGDLSADAADHAFEGGTGSAISTMVDWSPAGSGIRMTGGMLYDDDVFSDSRGLLPEVNGDELRSYVGIGYDGDFGAEGRLGLSIDMGLTFESLPGGIGNENFSDRNAEDAILGSRFESFRTTPSVSAGVEYRF